MTPNGSGYPDTNLADSVASRGLFKPASKWISILPPLDFLLICQALSLMSVSAWVVVLVQQRIWKVLMYIKL